ncbi:MAG: carbohydrate ABC transporter permease [Clostridia bacterium]|nr:carbohydrate ABC transporter permease [Clostridia bacterium]
MNRIIANKNRRIRYDTGTQWFFVFGYCLIGLVTLLCLLPFWLMISGSFTDEQAISKYGFNIIPPEFSLSAYEYIFKESWRPFLQAYIVTIGTTVIGTFVAVLFTSMAAYVLYRTDFRYRNAFAFYFYFTTLFSGGLIPWYILIVNFLGLKDQYAVLVVPMLLSSWEILLMRNFMKSIPDAVVESAKIDGANEFTIFARLVMPLSIAAIATIMLTKGLAYWNSWFLANLFVTSQKMYPLQFFLYRLLANTQFLHSSAGASVVAYMGPPPSESLKMATAVVVTGPIILLYPLLQRYFIKGIIIGAVKG